MMSYLVCLNESFLNGDVTSTLLLVIPCQEGGHMMLNNVVHFVRSPHLLHWGTVPPEKNTSTV